MTKKKHESEVVMCPVGRFFADLEGMPWKDSKFAKHLNKSRVEFLKAVRSLVDDRIESLEKKESGKEKKKTKIRVE